MTPTRRHARLGSNHQSGALKAVVERIAQLRGSTRPVVVFDLDSTLLDNRPRTLAILRELARRWDGPHPELATTLRRIEVGELPFLVEDLFARLGTPGPEVVKEACRFWADQFFSDRFLRHDRPYRGAVEFTLSCHRAGATVVYFTARDLERMGVGTVHSLCAHRFPFAVPRVELVMKPAPKASDVSFKTALAVELAEIGRVIAAFDNEPHHCNAIAAAHPEAAVFLIDTQHIPSAPELDSRVVVLGGFEIAEAFP